MDVKLEWKQGLQFTGTNSKGFNVPLAGTTEDGAPPDGFKPLEMLLIGLAGCTAMDVISILIKKQQVVTQFNIEVHAERSADHPRVFTEVTIEYILTGNELEGAAVKRAVELSETKYCAAMAMLRKNSPIHTKITLNQNQLV